MPAELEKALVTNDVDEHPLNGHRPASEVDEMTSAEDMHSLHRDGRISKAEYQSWLRSVVPF